MKSKQQYATREMHGGLDWRNLAKEMANQDMKVSASRARGLFMATMEKFARETLIRVKGTCTREEVKNLAMCPSFQTSIGRILRLAYSGEDK